MENLTAPEEQSTAEMITEYASLLWRWAWLLILLAFLAGGSAYYLSRRQTPVYQSSALAMINVATSSTDVTTSLYLAQQLGQSYSQIMTTRTVLDEVAKRLGFEILPGSIQVTPITNTQLLTVTATDFDPERAALIANTIVTVFIEQNQAGQAARYADSKQNLQDQMNVLDQQIQTTSTDLAVIGQDIQNDNTTLTALLNTDTTGFTQEQKDKQASLIQQSQLTLQSNTSQQTQLQTTLQNYRTSYTILLQSYESVRLAESNSSTGVLLKDPAVPAKAPIQPQPFRSGLLATVVGLFLGAGIVFLIEFLDDTIRDPQEIMRKWGVPVLGTIVNYKHDEFELITAKQPRSPITEAFRALRTNLQFTNFNLPTHTILVTSPSPEDGKTTVAANLANVIAQGGRKVVLVDADLRRPRIHKILQIPNRVGLTDLFIHPQDRSNSAAKQTAIAGLQVLTSGNLLPPNPSELLGSKRMSEILDQLASQFETTILDTPPLLVVTDALVLAARVDGVLIVVKPSLTKRAALKNILEQLRQVKANVIGIVLNDVKINRSRSHYYSGYYYSKKYSKGYQAKEPSEGSNVTGGGGSQETAMLKGPKEDKN